MVSYDEAFLLFHKWADEGTSLRFDGKSLLYSFSLMGTATRAADEVFALRVGDFGYIEIHLPLGTGIDYFDPDTLRADLSQRVGKGQKGEPIVYGAGIVAIKQTGEKFLFLEMPSGQ